MTHFYEFASRYYDEKSNGALFLRAKRRQGGTRTFKLIEGQPLETSYGTDLYREVFEIERQPPNVTSSPG